MMTCWDPPSMKKSHIPYTFIASRNAMHHHSHQILPPQLTYPLKNDGSNTIFVLNMAPFPGDIRSFSGWHTTNPSEDTCFPFESIRGWHGWLIVLVAYDKVRLAFFHFVVCGGLVGLKQKAGNGRKYTENRKEHACSFIIFFCNRCTVKVRSLFIMNRFKGVCSSVSQLFPVGLKA